MAKRQLKLGAFMRPVSIHTGAWRYPGAWPDANFNFPHIKRLIQKLEAGKFDAFFMADHLAVLNMPVNALKRSHTVTSFEPFTLLSALAGATEHIGLIATGSTTFDEPYHVARRFASLDHISGGRAGWNIVTTSNPDAALNFGLEDHMEHAERYKRAREFYDVVTGLWDSFADDAFVRDVEQGLYFDPAKMHVLDHKGKYLSVRGPLNIARPVQGWPLIVQAGASEDGKQLGRGDGGSRVHRRRQPCRQPKALRRYQGPHGQARPRSLNNFKILPGAFVVVGDSVEEAKEKRAQARQHGALRKQPSRRSRCSLAPTPPASIPTDNCRRSPKPTPARAAASGWSMSAARDRLTVRQLAQRVGGYGGLGVCRHARDHRRSDGGMADQPKAATGSTSCSRSCPPASTISSTRWCRNCRNAGFSARSMKARRCARIWGYHGRKTGSLSVNYPESCRFQLPENLDFGRI